MSPKNISQKIIIGITGPSGSGKTLISKTLTKKLKAPIIHLDNYWKYKTAVKIPSRKEWRKWEHPSSIDYQKLKKDIIKIVKTTNKRIILVEGFNMFHDKKIRDILNLKIYISIPDHLIVKRRLKKFGKKDNQEWYSKNIVTKSYKKYGEPTKKYADLVLYGNKNVNDNIKKILEYIKKQK